MQKQILFFAFAELTNSISRAEERVCGEHGG